jgi:hypothetical protein
MLVDELGALEAALQPFKSTISRIEAIRTALRAGFRDEPASSSHSITGAKYAAFIGACGTVSVVDTPALISHIGAKKYVEISTVSLKAIETCCGSDILGLVVSSRQAGPRPLVVSPIPEAAAAEVAVEKPKRKRAA